MALHFGICALIVATAMGFHGEPNVHRLAAPPLALGKAGAGVTVERAQIHFETQTSLEALMGPVVDAARRMKRDPESASAQVQSCIEVGLKVISSSKHNENLAMQNRAVRAGFMEHAVQAMQKHPDRSVQISCGHAIERVALQNVNAARAAVQAGAIPAIIAALKQQPMDRNVQGLSSAFGSLCNQLPESRALVKQGGGIELLFKTIKNFYQDESTMLAAWRGLGGVADDESAAQAIVKHGGLNLCVAFMDLAGQSFTHGSRLREEIMKVTKGLQKHSTANQEALIGAGFTDRVLATMNEEKELRGTQDIACENIGLLAANNPAVRVALTGAGAIETIMPAMSLYGAPDLNAYGGSTNSDVWPVIPTCTYALCALAVDNPKAHASITQAGGIQKLSATPKLSPDVAQMCHRTNLFTVSE